MSDNNTNNDDTTNTNADNNKKGKQKPELYEDACIFGNLLQFR